MPLWNAIVVAVRGLVKAARGVGRVIGYPGLVLGAGLYALGRGTYWIPHAIVLIAAIYEDFFVPLLILLAYVGLATLIVQAIEDPEAAAGPAGVAYQ